jgi:hypothetical protein
MSHTDRTLTIDDVWIKISDGIDHIYRIQDMAPKAYMELYT